MKILIVSDFHDRKILDIVPKEIIDEVTFIISVGDMEDNYPLPKESIGVYGNHESPDELNKKPSLNNVHCQVINYKGFSFYGIMGVFCGDKRYHNPDRRRWYHQLQSIIDEYLDKAPMVDFFLTHERAYGIFDEVHGKHVGNQGFRKYIDEKQPAFYISGHISNGEKLKMVGKTIAINPHSRLWDYVILELPSRKIQFMKGDKEV